MRMIEVQTDLCESLVVHPASFLMEPEAICLTGGKQSPMHYVDDSLFGTSKNMTLVEKIRLLPPPISRNVESKQYFFVEGDRNLSATHAEIGSAGASSLFWELETPVIRPEMLKPALRAAVSAIVATGEFERGTLSVEGNARDGMQEYLRITIRDSAPQSVSWHSAATRGISTSWQ
jgi:hypothetical protein